jgi:hypothetical protein
VRRSAARFLTRRILEKTLKIGALSVKATSRSSTARPQEKPEQSFRGDANGSRECAPDDRLRIEPGMTEMEINVR